MKKHLISSFLALGTFFPATAQYAPQAGIANSTAISASSAQIVNWATGCVVQRGWLDIAQPGLGHVSAGDSAAAIGAMDHFVVSLGDSGVATLSFSTPIADGAGFDFAVFENGFLNPDNGEEGFLELAFVEVSSDGVNFFRFPSASLTQDTAQISSVMGENYMNARLLNNLAGKYISGYGTPFDLLEMANISGLNINNITHVRIIDVVGSINGNTRFDASNRKINDPYPTPFPVGGFDLDAVAVLHQAWPATVNHVTQQNITLYPNPAKDILTVKSSEKLQIILSDVTGKILKQAEGMGMFSMMIQDLNSGIYFLNITNQAGEKWTERMYKL